MLSFSFGHRAQIRAQFLPVNPPLVFPGGQLFKWYFLFPSSVSYATFKDAVQVIRRLGKGALLAKVDIKSAFLLLPISRLYFNSLGFCFDNLLFFSTCVFLWVITCSVLILSLLLHFCIGWCLSSPVLIVLCITWMTSFLLVRLFFFFLLQLFSRISAFFSIPLAAEKTILPSVSIEFLGITVDSVAMEFRLPAVKIDRLKTSSRKVLLRELQSLLVC